MAPATFKAPDLKEVTRPVTDNLLFCIVEVTVLPKVRVAACISLKAAMYCVRSF